MWCQHKHSVDEDHYMRWDRHRVDPDRDSEVDGGVAPPHMQQVRPDRHYNLVVHILHSTHTRKRDNP